jgi:endoglucanase
VISYWGGDQGIPLPRQSFPINATSPGTDAAASAAAAFAASSMLYSGASLATSSSAYSPPSSLANATYAQLLLSHAKDLYNFANTTTRQTYQTAVPEVKGVYASSGWQDEMIWGGLWMALATNNSAYYADALSLYNSAQLKPQDKVFNWDSATPALPIVFLQIALARPSLATNAGLDANASGWQTVCEQMLDAIVNGQGRAQQTKGGLLYVG